MIRASSPVRKPMFDSKTLEFDKTLSLVSVYARTPMGRSRVLEMCPIADVDKLRRELDAMRDALRLKLEGTRWRFSELTDPEEILALLAIGDSSLSAFQLLEISAILTQAVAAAGLILGNEDSGDALSRIARRIDPSISEPARSINRKILPGGEIDDDATPKLRGIRSEITSRKASLTSLLESLLRKSESAVQDEIVTIRNDRFVIPVKADFKKRIKGVAHGASSSGATVFIEPLEAIEPNNELQTLKAREQHEVARILFSLTEELRGMLQLVENAVDTVAELDGLNAKMDFADAFSAIVPEISGDDALSLAGARHPLLEESLRRSESRDAIVPTTVELSGKTPVMVISGANAGGKTVVLKTVGLLAVMALSALPVPADSALVPHYRSVLADIGDQQSLASNLSTFSSHISNISRIVDEMRPPALVLLDEVGTGTDPDEGSALGVAIVDQSRKAGAQVIASTHYNGLKIYAANDDAVVNASVEFDERTLNPTYRLLTGTAGASSGLEMAERFGLDRIIVAHARENLSHTARETADYLQLLQNEARQSKDLLMALEDERAAVAERYANLDVEFHKKEKQRRREHTLETERLIREFERRSKQFLKTIKDKALKKKAKADLAAETARLRKQAAAGVGGAPDHDPKDDPDECLSDTAKTPKVSDKPIEKGSRVLIKQLGRTGVVEKVGKETAEVLVGSVRMKQNLADLMHIAQRKQERRERSKPASGKLLDEEISRDRALELNLLGLTALEAEDEIDKFLDEAYSGGLDKVRIIHGFGTGVLRSAVRSVLKGHPHVDSYEFAPQNEGGRGATIVVLKK